MIRTMNVKLINYDGSIFDRVLHSLVIHVGWEFSEWCNTSKIESLTRLPNYHEKNEDHGHSHLKILIHMKIHMWYGLVREILRVDISEVTDSSADMPNDLQGDGYSHSHPVWFFVALLYRFGVNLTERDWLCQEILGIHSRCNVSNGGNISISVKWL